MSDEEKVSVTVLLSGGRLSLELMAEVHRVAARYGLGIYLTTLQNVRLYNIPKSKAEAVKQELAAAGAEFKAPGKFPLPRVCIGEDACNLGLIDTMCLSEKIVGRFHDKQHTKAKFKIAVAGCQLCCSSPKTTDIGVVATRDGYELYAGGKGGPFPKTGRRIGQKLTEDQVVEMIEALVSFHDHKTLKKQRMYKLLSDPEFPYPEL
ncbi:NAD(P)/FAD-dependent oxidoreductase [Desulforhopalus singaporensis]|uniref:Nitrite/Sulfite reductase ferredoxin-like half domain-containing protein n=1 Tax=Desulforhopalus singaporensis TaxID=91360 RepID=A0A1H0JAY1_9BACT|nr:nitrite reductase [Desulforhopalus singaporensis]SDO40794.1 Nitrite/Sulfite reductase ferredoxin-like half domain-containing protein [Desulforhopalus singaporensis]